MVNITRNDELLTALNDQTVVLMIPVIIYVSVLMLLGSVGNVLVCVYYGCKSRSSTNSFFIVALAVFDLMVCMITMPIEIVDLRFYYMFMDIPACKISRFLNHIAANGSAITLLVIAMDRYRRMCRPLSPQLHIRHAKIAAIFAVIGALVLSWPALIFYEPVNVNVTDPSNESIILQGSDCTTTKNDAYKSYLWAFNIIQFLIFIAATIALCVLYSLICRSIYRYKGRRLKYASTRKTTYNKSDASVNDSKLQNGTSESSLQTVETVSETVEKTTEAQNNSATNKGPNLDAKNGSRSAMRQSVSNAKEKTPDIKTIKCTVMMLVITVIYVVGYLPYLVLVIWRIFQAGYEGDILSDAELVGFQIGIRSYLLNSAINPILYIFFNEHFRRFLFATFCPCCVKKGETPNSSTSFVKRH